MSQLLLCRTFPPTVGGIERYVSELFQKAHVDVHVLAPRVPNAIGFDKAFPHPVTRFPVIPLWRRGKGPLLPMAAWAAALVARKRPRVVYSDQVQTGAVGVPLSRITGVPHVTFAYGIELTPSRLYRLKRRVFSSSAFILAISTFAKDALVSVYGIDPEMIALARPGVDTDRFAPDAGGAAQRRRMGLKSTDLVLLTVGRLDPSQRYKGYDRLIRLMRRLQPEFPQLRLLVVGDGDDRAWLKTLASEERVTSQVMFAGRVGEDELPNMYRVADLFVLPSGAPDTDPFCVEGYGIVFAEASASGVPSVAYRLGGTADAIVDGVTGVLTDATENAFCGAVRDLLSDRERRLKMGQAARQHALRALVWDAAVATLRRVSACLEGGTFRKSRTLTEPL